MGRQQAEHDLGGNFTCVTLMLVKYYASCVCISHMVLIFLHTGSFSRSHIFPACDCPLSTGLLVPLVLFYFFFHFDNFLPSIQQALIQHLAYALYISMGPGLCLLLRIQPDCTSLTITCCAERGTCGCLIPTSPPVPTYTGREWEHCWAPWSQLRSIPLNHRAQSPTLPCRGPRFQLKHKR